MWNVLLGQANKRHGRQKDFQRCDFGFGISLHFHRLHHLWEHWGKFSFSSEFLLIQTSDSQDTVFTLLSLKAEPEEDTALRSDFYCF